MRKAVRSLALAIGVCLAACDGSTMTDPPDPPPPPPPPVVLSGGFSAPIVAVSGADTLRFTLNLTFAHSDSVSQHFTGAYAGGGTLTGDSGSPEAFGTFAGTSTEDSPALVSMTFTPSPACAGNPPSTWTGTFDGTTLSLAGIFTLTDANCGVLFSSRLTVPFTK